MRAWALAGVILLLAPALAGCGAKDDTPGATKDQHTIGSSTGTGSSANPVVVTDPAPRPKGTSERWHFHDYWHGSPTITLIDANLTFNVTPAGPDGVPSLSAFLDLPHGVIVPPETGYLTINVSWTPDTTGLVNVSFRPADSNDWFTAGDASSTAGIILPTTESMCDVPHRQASAWRFNLTAKAGGTPPSPPQKDIHILVNATIGRPLFIDPPHFNWWQNGETFAIVANGAGAIRSAKTPAANLSLPAGLPGAPDAAKPVSAPPPPTDPVRIPVDSGVIVPEGAKTIIAFLNWTSTAPSGKLALRYYENNLPSEGPLDVATDGANTRVYTLHVAQASTDTTYSNRTTWEFRVVPEGDPAAAFDGTFTLVAFVTRLEGAEALSQFGS